MKTYLFLFFVGLCSFNVIAQTPSNCSDLTKTTLSLKAGKTLLCTSSTGFKYYGTNTKGVITYQVYDKKGTLLGGRLLLDSLQTAPSPAPGGGTIKSYPVTCKFCYTYTDEDGHKHDVCTPVSCSNRQ